MREDWEFGSKSPHNPPLLTPQRQARIRKKRRRRLFRLGLLFLMLIGIGTTLWRVSHPARRSGPSAPLTPAPSRYPDPPGIVLHASNSPGVVHKIPIDAIRLNEIHHHDHPHWRTEFEGKVYYIGYHYVVLPNGKVEQGRPDHCPGCHAPHFNNYLGICVVGCFDPSMPDSWKPSRPTPAQIVSVVALCERLMSEYHIPPDKVLRHRDTKETWCPGRRFPFKEIQDELIQYAALHPETRPLGAAVISAGPQTLRTLGQRH